MASPMPTVVATINVASIPATNIGPFYAAPDRVTRLYVRNVSGAIVMLAFDSSVVNAGANNTARFELPAGQDVTFILMPRQQVFAVAGGAGRISYTASEAFPIIAQCEGA